MRGEPNYTLVFEETSEYLLARVTDTEIALPDAIDYTNTVMRRFRESSYKRLIVTLDVPLMMSETQLEIFGDVIANMLGHDARMAIVDLNDSLPEWMLVAGTAQRRGRNVMCFDDFDDATRWITDPCPSPEGSSVNQGR